MSEIGMGTLYDFNKVAMENVKKINKPIMEKKKNLMTIFLQNKNNEYYMILCNELRDYTILKVNDKKYKEAAEVVVECMQNRGDILAIDETEDRGAIEIWIKYNSDKKIYCYYLFPYDTAIVEV